MANGITIDLPTTAAELGRAFGARLVGDGEARVARLAPLRSVEEGALTFLADRKYCGDLKEARGGVVLTREELLQPGLPVTFLVVSDPQRAFASVAHRLNARHSWRGVSEKAVVDPRAELGPDVHVGPFAVIEPGARIGRGTRVFAHAYVGEGVQIGEQCEIYPQATLLPGVVLGDRVRVFPGAVLGSEGFGLFVSDGKLTEMPQIGTVVIEDDVRIGSNCTVDRATLGATRIARGSKLDDQVHVGHNTQIGKDCIVCGQVGIAGSAVLEDGVILGGQVGVGDGVRIGSGAKLGGQAGVSSNLKGGETYMGYPATPARQLTRIVRQWRRLPEIVARLRQVEKHLGISVERDREE